MMLQSRQSVARTQVIRSHFSVERGGETGVDGLEKAVVLRETSAGRSESRLKMGLGLGLSKPCAV